MIKNRKRKSDPGLPGRGFLFYIKKRCSEMEMSDIKNELQNMAKRLADFRGSL
jgi:hypothetical protein